MQDVYNYPAMDRAVFGQPTARVVAAEAERLRARRVIVSGAPARATDEEQKVRQALGPRCAGPFDLMAAYTAW